jgi:hypothetical protein
MRKKSIAERLEVCLEFEESEDNRAMRLLYGDLPAWFPLPRLELAKRTIHQLRRLGFTCEQISQFVIDHIADKRLIQGVMLSGDLVRLINELTHIKYALAQPANEGLEMLAGKLAATGKKFCDGRKRGTGGSIRKAIAKLLKTSPGLKNPELWDEIKAKLPKRWQAFDNDLGKYLEDPHMKVTGYGRFCNICGQERKKITG